MKQCSKCKSDKGSDEFYKSSRNKDGLRSECKVCSKADNTAREHLYYGTRKTYREEHKKEAASNKKIYYINNREKILKSNANYRQSLNYKWIAYRASAKRRSIEWCLTLSQFEEYWNKDCHYCGNEIGTIGIDRMNSKGAYTKENIVPCCSFCNTIKMDLTYEEFTEQITKIFNHLELWEHIKRSKVIS